MKPSSSIIKQIGIIIVTLCIEKMLSPFVEKVFEYISRGDSYFAKWIIRRIANGRMINLSFYIIVILFIIISFYMFSIGKDDYDNTCNKSCLDCSFFRDTICRINRFIYKEQVIKCLKVCIVAGLILFLGIVNHINHTVIRIQNNIEIVSPYISEDNYKEIYSRYYQMTDYHDYADLCDEINGIGFKEELKLQ